VRPVYFPRIDGMMEWSAPDGTLHAHSFDDSLDSTRASQRLRTALSLDGEWLPHVLRQGHEQLLRIRAVQPDAGGLVIATDQDHARGIARIFRDRFKVKAVVATSDDPEASNNIARFAATDTPWIVAVRMVSEGVDIPRLRVGIFATTTTTELFFRQAVGRLVRWTRGTKGQKSFLFIPDEPRLRARAFAIAEQRRHSLRHEDRAELFARAEADPDADLFSAFEAISAVPLGGSDDEPDWVLDDDSMFFEPAPDEALTIPLPPLPTGGAASSTSGRTLKEDKDRLRDAMADKARLIARHTGQSHAAVNAELNRVSGVKRVSEATVEQLEKRLAKAEAWLRQASARRVAG
jgi:superfamily II DNA or RNA helicase